MLSMEPPSWQQTAGKAITEQMVFLKKANWQVMAMYLMYLWFRKTRISIRGQTIPRIQITIWILHDFFSFC